MGTFRHTPDNVIFINNTFMPLSFFLTQEPAYTLPAPYITRYYEQTVVHYVTDGRDQTTLSSPYVDGDNYITNEATYAANYAAYLAAQALPQTLSAAKSYQISAMLMYSQTFLNSGLNYSGTIFPTDTSNTSTWAYGLNYSERNNNQLNSFYVLDNSGNQVNVFSIDLIFLLNFLDELSWNVRSNQNLHTANINALGNIPAVLAYNYTTGWPTVPYVSSNWGFYASYASTLDADYSLGSATGTAIGGAAIVGGFLDLAHNDVRYVNYSATSNADFQQIGTINFILRPNYSGTPAVNDQVFFAISKADTDNFNLIELYHANADGKLYLIIKDSAGVDIVNVGLGAWSPVSGTDYNIVISYNINWGLTYLTVDDQQIGSIQTGVGTRDVNIGLLRVGNNYDSTSSVNSNFKIKKFNIYKI